MTICLDCANCAETIIEYSGYAPPQYVCMATPREKELDYVTGREVPAKKPDTTNIIGLENLGQFVFCHYVNTSGKCDKYVKGKPNSVRSRGFLCKYGEGFLD